MARRVQQSDRSRGWHTIDTVDISGSRRAKYISSLASNDLNLRARLRSKYSCITSSQVAGLINDGSTVSPMEGLLIIKSVIGASSDRRLIRHSYIEVDERASKTIWKAE